MFLFLNTVFCDAPEHWQIGMQDPATPIMEAMNHFHNYLMLFLIGIGLAVFWLMYCAAAEFERSQQSNHFVFTHSSVLEIIWTVVPAVILVLIAIPSFALLYSLDDVSDPALTLKVIGHQWYWSYEYSDYATLEGGETLTFDSYMLPTSDLFLGAFRLLEVDNRVVLPTSTHVRVLISSADVLHSWAIPALGIKVDATPGRLSQASLFLKREGVYYGQCSEICGVNHAFMPIVIKAVSKETFVEWIKAKLENLVVD
jgi:cytochrome c oxidase subunit 2